MNGNYNKYDLKVEHSNETELGGRSNYQLCLNCKRKELLFLIQFQIKRINLHSFYWNEYTNTRMNLV